jgi:hypothetical protein
MYQPKLKAYQLSGEKMPNRLKNIKTIIFDMDGVITSE